MPSNTGAARRIPAAGGVEWELQEEVDPTSHNGLLMYGRS